MRKRPYRFEVRFTEDELSHLKSQALKCGLSTSEYIRQSLSTTIPKEKPDEEFYQWMRELSAMGNRMNQIAIKANALGFIDVPMLQEEVQKWADFRLQIRKRFLLPDQRL